MEQLFRKNVHRIQHSLSYFGSIHQKIKQSFFSKSKKKIRKFISQNFLS